MMGERVSRSMESRVPGHLDRAFSFGTPRMIDSFGVQVPFTS
jgi:hypothetical protein